MTDLSEAQDLNISAFWRVLPQDLDPVETREWIDALNQIVEIEGPERATFILMKLIEQARRLRVPLPPVVNTPYGNTVSLADQPQFPGNPIALIRNWADTSPPTPLRPICSKSVTTISSAPASPAIAFTSSHTRRRGFTRAHSWKDG
jgi:hypothetical protein